MYPLVSPPTDSWYKFLALFGLALIISGVASFVASYSSAFDRKIAYTERVMALEAAARTDTLSVNTLAFNKRLLQITGSNEKLVGYGVSGLIGLGLVLSAGGFTGWKTEIHARERRLAELQEDKLKAEVQKLKAETRALSRRPWNRRS